VSLPSAGAFGQVREGMRVDHGDMCGLRVAVKIISRRLIKKVSSPRAGLHSLQRADAILDPMRVQRVGCGHSDSTDRPDRLRLRARSAAGATEPTAIDGAPGREWSSGHVVGVSPCAAFPPPDAPCPPYDRGTLVCAPISDAGMCAHTARYRTPECVHTPHGAARICGASAGIPCFPVLVQASHDISCRQVRNGNENLKKEIRCIKLVKHPNVIKLCDTVDEEDSDKVYLIFELANFLSLQDLCDWVRDHGIRDPITQEDKKCLPFPHVRLLLKQLLQGLQACHSKASAILASLCPHTLSCTRVHRRARALGNNVDAHERLKAAGHAKGRSTCAKGLGGRGQEYGREYWNQGTPKHERMQCRHSCTLAMRLLCVKALLCQGDGRGVSGWCRVWCTGTLSPPTCN
jgi:serine/threonine protein kinase